MKMLLAIMPTNLSDLVSQSLLKSGYRVTKYASTEGLITQGTTSLLIVADSDRIDSALATIRELIPPGEETSPAHARVTIYIVPVTDYGRV